MWPLHQRERCRKMAPSSGASPTASANAPTQSGFLHRPWSLRCYVRGLSAGSADNKGGTCGQVGRQVAQAIAGLVQLHAQRVVLGDRAPWEAAHLLPTARRPRRQPCSCPP